MRTLTDKEKEFWCENSYVVFRKMFAERIDDISGWIEEVRNWPDNNDKWLKFYEMDNDSVLSRVENFVPYHSQVANILLGEELTGLISDLMGEEAILYKDRINFKPPGGGAHAAHQDGVAYESSECKQFDENKTPYISVLISVDPATVENGCFEIATGWPVDNLDILPMERPYKDNPNFSKITGKYEEQLNWKRLETDPGDVILFTERVPHRSGKNTSGQNRRILYGVYNPAGEGDKRTTYFEGKRKNINNPRYMVGNPHAPVT